MHRVLVAAAALLALAACCLAQPSTQPATQPATRPATAPAFVRGKIGQNSTYGVSSEPASRAFIDVELTANEPTQVGEDLRQTIFVGPFKGDPSYDGVYTLIADEPFEVKITGGSPAKVVAPGKIEVKITDAAGRVRPTVTPQLHLLFPGRTTLPKGLQILQPGYASAENVWADAYLATIRRLNPGVWRAMDWQRTNGSQVVKWSDVARPGDRQGLKGRGGAPHYPIDLCNRVGMDLWLCVPHMADDECVRQFALLARDTLRPDLFVVVEYSNEVWNTYQSIGLNTAYCKAMGKADPECDGPNDTVKARQWYAKRAAQVGAIFRSVFAEKAQEDRVRLVLSGQASYPEQLQWSVDWLERKVGPLGTVAHGIAVAPYFGADASLEDAPGLTADDFLAPGPDGKSRLERSAAAVLGGPKMQSFFALARAKGVKAMAYEWSDGFATKASPDVPGAVNRDPRVAGCMKAWADLWFANGGDVACHFVAVAEWDSDSSYGATDSVSRWGPKAQAIADASALRPHESYVPPDPRLVEARAKLAASEAARARAEADAAAKAMTIDAVRAALSQ